MLPERTEKLLKRLASEVTSEAWSVAEEPDLPSPVIEALFDHPQVSVLVALAVNPTLSPEVVERLLAHKNIRTHAITNSPLTLTQMWDVVERGNTSDWEDLADRSETLPEEIVRALVVTGRAIVVATLSANHGLPDDLRMEMILKNWRLVAEDANLERFSAQEARALASLADPEAWSALNGAELDAHADVSWPVPYLRHHRSDLIAGECAERRVDFSTTMTLAREWDGDLASLLEVACTLGPDRRA